MQNLALCLAVSVCVAVTGTRLRSAPSSCVAELPVAEGWGERAAFQRVLGEVLPDVAQGYGQNSSVVAKSRAHGETEEACLEDVYGEVTTKGLTQLWGVLRLAESDVFVDLGSGLGKLPIQAAALGGARAAVGVELSAKRHALACNGLKAAAFALRTVIKGKKPARTSRVELVRADMFKQDLSHATVVFMASLCFRDPMMSELGRKLARELPESARIASLKQFVTKGMPPRLAVYSASSTTIDTTWSPSAEVYLFHAQGTPPGKDSAPLGVPGKSPPM